MSQTFKQSASFSLYLRQPEKGVVVWAILSSQLKMRLLMPVLYHFVMLIPTNAYWSGRCVNKRATANEASSLSHFDQTFHALHCLLVPVHCMLLSENMTETVNEYK